MADFVGSVENKMEGSPQLMKNNTRDSIVRGENKVRDSALVTGNKMANSGPIVGMCSKCGMQLVEIIEVLGKKEKLA